MQRQGVLTRGGKVCGGVLEFDQDRILLEVVCQKHGIPNSEAFVREIGLRLVRLEATERCKVRFALCDVQNCLCSILTNVVFQQTANENQINASGGADACVSGKGWMPMRAGVLEGCERRCGRQEAAQHNCTRHTNALVIQIELSDGVLAQGDERNAAEIGQHCVLEDDIGQFIGAISSDLVEPDTAQDQSQKSNVRGR